MAVDSVSELEREFRNLATRAELTPSVVEMTSIQRQLNHIIGQLEALKPLPGQTNEIDRRVIQLEKDIDALSDKLSLTQLQISRHETKSKERSNEAMLVALFGVLLAVVGAAFGILSVFDDNPTVLPSVSAEPVPDSTTISQDTTTTSASIAQRTACPTTADTETVFVPAGSEVVAEWSGEGVRVLQCVTPNGQIVYYGWSSVGDILLPARIQSGELVATNLDTTYRLDRTTGGLEIIQSGSRIAYFRLDAVQ